MSEKVRVIQALVDQALVSGEYKAKDGYTYSHVSGGHWVGFSPPNEDNYSRTMSLTTDRMREVIEEDNGLVEHREGE